MAQRLFIFRAGSRELVLPVTPDSYRVSRGINVETVNIHTLGDVALAGYGTLSTVGISCLFPARSYSFSADSDPETYIKQFQNWVKQRTKLRFIVGDTAVNLRVFVESFSHGERDGTNDVYAEISLREYRPLDAPITEAAPADTKPREAPAKATTSSAELHSVQYGDTLSALCRAKYGDGSAAVYNRVAALNGISNPNLIRVGQSIQFPHPLT